MLLREQLPPATVSSGELWIIRNEAWQDDTGANGVHHLVAAQLEELTPITAREDEVGRSWERRCHRQRIGTGTWGCTAQLQRCRSG